MKKEITIPELIRHLNHEYLNNVNLIQMYIDLGKIDECKEIIKEMTAHYQKFSNIHQLNCPNLITWIDTFSYSYPSIKVHIESNILSPIPKHLDEKITNYLNKTVEHVYTNLDPFVEQNLTFSVQTNNDKFEILFDLKGNWNTEKFNTKNDNDLIIETYEQTNQSWKYVIQSK